MILLVIHALLLLLGTPGLDMLGKNLYTKAEDREKFTQRYGVVLAQIAFGFTTFNREVRLPLTDIFEPLQRPFRISQNWNLYRDGPNRLWRMEILVDDRLVYRSVDEEYDWMELPFRNRRLRPMVEAVIQEKDATNWPGLVRFIVRHAREDFPDAQRVEVRAMVGNFPGRKMSLDHGFYAEAPKWDAKKLPEPEPAAPNNGATP